MNKFKSLSFLKWVFVWTSTLSMLMSPLAMGAEAKKASKVQMQTIVNELGLNKKITMGEFYEKNKHLIPERVRNEIEASFLANRNVLMPSFEVLSTKNSAGEEIPTIRMTQGGELINMQWFGEREKLVKIQNTTLTEVDVVNFDDMFVRMVAGDEKFRKQSQKSSVTKGQVNFKKYPDVTRAEWKTMSDKDKAAYIVNLRLLWQDSVKVLAEKEQAEKGKTPAKGKKTSQNFFEKNQYFFSLFMGETASASTDTSGVIDVGGGGGQRRGGAAAADGQEERGVESGLSGQYCIVAGYVARYRNSSICDKATVEATYNRADNTMYQAAKEQCPGQLACNPYIYGFKSDGKAFCVTPDSNRGSSFQTATHWNGLCENGTNKLSSEKISVVNDESKNNARYEDGNLKSEADIKAAVLAKDGINLTDKYLLSVLKFKNLAGNKTTSIFDGGIDDQVLAQVQSAKSAFDEEIRLATESCKYESRKSKAQAGRYHERNYWGACDQLFARQLSVNELFASKCGGADKLNTETLKCKCEGGAEVLPGAQCAARIAVAASPDPSPRASVEDTPRAADCAYAAVPGINETTCKCSNGSTPRLANRDNTSGAESYTCDGGQTSGGGTSNKKSCGLFCKLWKGVKTIAPYAIAGVAAYFILKSMAPKKPTLTPAADLCPGTTTPPPCAQTCAPPLALTTTGTCACTACPPGQTSDSACNCVTSSGSTGTGTGTTYICPDSVTSTTDLTTCPTYSCWNGQSYQNPMNCPPQTSTSTNSISTPISNPNTGTGR